MAGGFGAKGPPLHVRVRVGGVPDGSLAATTGPGSRDPGDRAVCPARHCWVDAPVDGGPPRPGLLLEWRRGRSGWEGRVAYAAELRAERWGTVEEWLPAAAVSPLGTATPSARL